MLLLDGYNSHVTSKVVDFCVANDIILLCLLAHTTHHLQPLDVDLFQPLGTIYKTALADEICLGLAAKIDKSDYLHFIIC